MLLNGCIVEWLEVSFFCLLLLVDRFYFMVFLGRYFLFVAFLIFFGVFFVVGDSSAQTCVVTRATGDTYSGTCLSTTGTCSSGQIGFIDGVSGCSFATDMCCVTPPSGGFSCGTSTEKGFCKNDCGGDTPLSAYDYGYPSNDQKCPSVTLSKCCKSASSTSTSCTGKDSSGAAQTGTCSTTATCSSGTALTSATGCSSGKACCYTSSTSSGTGTTSTSSSCAGSQNAGIVPCGRSCDNSATTDVDESQICTLCHLFLLMKNITSWIFMVMTYIAFAVLVAMGVLYIVSAGNTQMIGIAKNGIKAALYGFAIVLLGWVAINVILMVLADGALGSDTATFSFKTNGSWFTYSCDAKSKYVRTGIDGVTSGTSNGSGSGSGDGSGSGSGPGNGTCSVISSGYCTTDNLGKACSWNAEAASKVCNVESGGNTSAASNTDRCQNESGDKFSFGLFQLNIISNGCMLGSDCCWQNVFSLENGNAGNNGGRKKTCTNSKGVSYVCGWGCTVTNRSKYTECSQRAMDAVKNIEAACTLYKQSGWSPWPVTKKTCGL